MGDNKTVEWWDEWAPRQRSSSGAPAPHGKSLAIEMARLPTPTATDARASGGGPWPTLTDAARRRPAEFGQYAAAVARWAPVVGRLAPPPTAPDGADGAARLSPRFVEWLMGLPDGWVTDVPGLTRSDMLRALGNGVVPQQGAAALLHLATVIRDAARTGGTAA